MKSPQSVVVTSAWSTSASAAEHGLPAGGVQLRHHIVQQQERRVPGLLPHHLHLGQLERQRRGALLAARAEGAQVVRFHREGQVVAMRADQRAARGDVAAARLSSRPDSHRAICSRDMA